MKPLHILETFDEKTLPTLDTVVLGALEYLEKEAIPALSIPYTKPLIIGSGNAIETGKILFADVPAIFATESTYLDALRVYTDIDGVVLISASGAKHAIAIATEIHAQGLPLTLLTNTAGSPAESIVGTEKALRFPKIREPYTYNVSTYMSMLLAKSGEDPFDIRMWLCAHVVPIAEEIARNDAFCFVIDGSYAPIAAMVRTKFDELFGAKVVGRAFTFGEVLHAKTIVSSPAECFIYIGEGQKHTLGSAGKEYTVPMPHGSGSAAYMATLYYIIGIIQKAKPPYFMENLPQYIATTETFFGHKIEAIVE